ncbi:MAG: thermonuclease family protein [Rhodobacteraceae bacterium]|nr:thermonuclease family protein [Paracoccaceae bacterium]
MFGFFTKKLLRLVIASGRRRPRQKPTKKYRVKSRYKHPAASYTINGKAYVIDGDSIRCNGYEIRLDDVDAPEYDQFAYDQNGQSVPIGAIAKSALIKKIGGKTVKVKVSKTDLYGREVGTIFYGDENINLWLIKRGLAVSAFGNKYFKAEQWAKNKRLGIWGLELNHTPQEWRKKYTVGS